MAAHGIGKIKRFKREGKYDDAKLEWCCGVLNEYPDLVPLITWGSMTSQTIKDEWAVKDCDDRVGGSSKSNCTTDSYMIQGKEENSKYALVSPIQIENSKYALVS